MSRIFADNSQSIGRTPLVRLNVPEAPAEIWLKLENLQPVGCFKLRGGGQAYRRKGRSCRLLPSGGRKGRNSRWAFERLEPGLQSASQAGIVSTLSKRTACRT